jgi:hypothetical protein
MDDQGTNRKSGEVSPLAQFFVVLCAAAGTFYGMSRNGDRELMMGGGIACGAVLLIVGVFLFVKRTK